MSLVNQGVGQLIDWLHKMEVVDVDKLCWDHTPVNQIVEVGGNVSEN